MIIDSLSAKPLSCSVFLSEEVESLNQEFQQKLDAIRTEALHLKNTEHDKGLAERESMILEERQTLENELEKNIAELKGEIKSTKTFFSKLNKELSASISSHLLN
jgi:F0F1-type ATP synthase membrane subunit b/b'